MHGVPIHVAIRDDKNYSRGLTERVPLDLFGVAAAESTATGIRVPGQNGHRMITDQGDDAFYIALVCDLETCFFVTGQVT